MDNNIQNISYGIAFAVITLLVVSYYFGSLAHLVTGTLPEEVITAARFITFPLGLTAALVLVLLLANSRQSFDERELLLEKFAAQGIMLTREIYYKYGDKGADAHNALRDYVKHIRESKPMAILGMPNKAFSEPLVHAIENLPINPKDPATLLTRDHIQQLQRDMSLTRMQIATKQRTPIRNESILLVTLWFCAVYACLGITSPWGNRLLMGYGLVSAACVASSIWLLCEWSQPLAGLITLSDHPIEALEVALKNTDKAN